MKLVGTDRFSIDAKDGAAGKSKDPQKQDRPFKICGLGSFETVEKRNEKQGRDNHAAKQDIEQTKLAF